MTTPKLPSKLAKEPLIDAVFEIRFASAIPASNVLPGVLYAKLAGEGQSISIDRLPISQLPEAVRNSDPGLQYAPLVLVSWGQFNIMIGDKTISVSCKPPYPGWKTFRGAIRRIIKEVYEANIVQSVERYSIKYVDLIVQPDLRKQVSSLNWGVRLGSHNLSDEIATVRIEIRSDDYMHIVGVQTGAAFELPERGRCEGFIVDTDSICPSLNIDLSAFLAGMDEKLDAIHSANKVVFFDCLTQAAIDSLEPSYE